MDISRSLSTSRSFQGDLCEFCLYLFSWSATWDQRGYVQSALKTTVLNAFRVLCGSQSSKLINKRSFSRLVSTMYLHCTASYSERLKIKICLPNWWPISAVRDKSLIPNAYFKGTARNLSKSLMNEFRVIWSQIYQRTQFISLGSKNFKNIFCYNQISFLTTSWSLRDWTWRHS